MILGVRARGPASPLALGALVYTIYGGVKWTTEWNNKTTVGVSLY